MALNILGTEYNIEVKKYDDDPSFEKLSFVAYCSGITKRIVLCDLHTRPGWEDETEEAIQKAMNLNLRHEIVHAFFHESGLMESSLAYGEAWAQNEEMVDWIAIQGQKIYKAWQEARCI